MLHRLALLAALLPVFGAAHADTLVGKASNKQVIDKVVQLVNKARSEGRRCGSESFPSTAPLATAAPLHLAAQSHASDMAQRSYFEHRGKDGRAPRDRVIDAGYKFRLTGENIAFGAVSAEEVVAGWLASPGHCANIMDGRFRHTGVGVSTAKQAGHIYWVQTFGSPSGS